MGKKHKSGQPAPASQSPAPKAAPLNVCFFGPKGAGKTTLLDQKRTGSFNKNLPATAGMVFVDIPELNLKVADISQDRPGLMLQDPMIATHTSKARACVFVVDASSSDKLDANLVELTKIHAEIKGNIPAGTPFFLVANKVDGKNKVPTDEIESKLKNFAQTTLGVDKKQVSIDGQNDSKRVHIHVTSAKNGNGIKNLFKQITRVAQDKVDMSFVHVDNERPLVPNVGPIKPTPKHSHESRKTTDLAKLDQAISIFDTHTTGLDVLLRNDLIQLKCCLSQLHDQRLRNDRPFESIEKVSEASLVLVQALYGPDGKGPAGNNDSQQISTAINAFGKVVADNFPSNHFMLKLGLAIIALGLLIAATTLTGGLALPMVAGVSMLVGAAIGAGAGAGIISGVTLATSQLTLPHLKDQNAARKEANAVHKAAEEVMTAARSFSK